MVALASREMITSNTTRPFEAISEVILKHIISAYFLISGICGFRLSYSLANISPHSSIVLRVKAGIISLSSNSKIFQSEDSAIMPDHSLTGMILISVGRYVVNRCAYLTIHL